MKKIIAIIVGLLFICSCTITVTTDEKEKERISKSIEENSELVDVEIDGHKHEFLIYKNYAGGGTWNTCIAHWPDCKYCKQRGTYYNY